MKICLIARLILATSRIPDGFQEETNWTLYCRNQDHRWNLSRAYDAINENHVFAEMSVSLQRSTSIFVRMVDSVDPSTGVMFTAIPWVSGFTMMLKLILHPSQGRELIGAIWPSGLSKSFRCQD
jgi:hypothetical protein